MGAMNRHAARRDAAEPAIVKALVKAGASVARLSDTGVADLIVAYTSHEDFIRPITVLMEVKTGKGKLTPEQEAFHGKWQGEIYIVHTPQEALSIIGIPEADHCFYID